MAKITCTDADLKRFREVFACDATPHEGMVNAVLARLEAAEKVIKHPYTIKFLMMWRKITRK